MEQRNSLIVILLAAILGSAAIAPRSTGTADNALLGASSESAKATANASSTPLRAQTAKGIVKEFFSAKPARHSEPDVSVDALFPGPQQLPGGPTAKDQAKALESLNGILAKLLTGRGNFWSAPSYHHAYTLLEALSLGRIELPELPEESAENYYYWTVDSLIATVPDPVESGLDTQFDDYVDSIEHAVFNEYYVFDHFYNPWPSRNQPAKKSNGDQSGGQADATDDDSPPEKQKVPLYEREPGLVLFHDPDHRRLLVLFLVGETSTTGIHKRAFESALKQASELPISDPSAKCPHAGPGCESPLKVLGPTFSGSATSMDLAIQEWATRLGDSAPGVSIISGSATAVNPDRFGDLRQGTYQYQTTIIPNESELEALLSWLGGPDGKDVAILNEENTAFGYSNTPLYSIRNPSWSREQYRRQWNTLHLSFPPHIAELQQAAERAEEAAKTGSSTLPSLSNPNLPLDIHESRTRRDLLPLYSTAETNRQELVLDANLRAINEHRINYVIVTATDPADILFLVHLIRQNCPTVTPIVLNADLLYLHTNVNADTRGMIVASTYPLYLENQLWALPSDRGRSAIQFSLDTSEGIYNATVALLAGRPPLLDYVNPFASDSTKPRCPEESETHPLWISMVGADQIWPISIQDACIPANYMVPIPTGGASAATDDRLRLYPKAFTRICGLIALGCLLVCSLILGKDTSIVGFSPIAWLRSKTPNSVRQILGPAVLPEYSDTRRWVTLLFSLVLICLWATVAYYFFLPFRMGIAGELVDAWKFWAALVAASAVVVVWLALIVPQSWIAKIDPLQTGEPPWSSPPGRILSLVVLFPSAVVIACAIVWMIPPGDPVARLFLFLRTADFSSKVSPLVPMLLSYAAAIALILGALRRLALLESRQVLTPFLNFGTPSFSGFADLEQRVRILVGTTAWSWRSCAIGAPIAIAYWLAFPNHQWLQRNIDTFGFEFWFFAISCAVYIGICLAIVKMVTVWLSVRTLLRRIYTHPSRGGYSAYRQQLHFLKEPAVDLLSRVPAMSQLEVALDQVRQLIITSDETSTGASLEVETRLSAKRLSLALLLPRVEESINETEQAQASAQWRESILAKRQTETWMTFLSWSIAYIFEPLWRTVNANRRPQSPAGTASKDSKPIDTIGEIYVASRVVDFLRQVMPQLESLALTTTLAMLLMLFAVSSYPFPARDGLLWFSWFVVLATVGSMMWMFFSLNRDRIASMIAGTTPGQIDWNSTLVLQVVTHALIPILVLLGAAFPAKLGALATWIGTLFGGHA